MTDKNLYDRVYFESGDKVGGYTGTGYLNFPAQLNVLNKILDRKPESVLDVGGARGYIIRMLEQRGISGYCVDISEYCYSTRATDKFINTDITTDDLPLSQNGGIKPIDLCFSIACFEHLPESSLEHVIKEISRVCKRGFICPSFNNIPNDQDKTHETLRSKEWWEATFKRYAPDWPVEIMDKEDCEKGNLEWQQPQQIKVGDRNWTFSGKYVKEDIETMSNPNDKRKIVLNIGSYTTMFRSNEDICLINTDIPEIKDLDRFAISWGSNFTTYTAPERIPLKDNSVDEINMSHVFEHLSREEGSNFLKEVLRVLKPYGSIRITVPDASKLVVEYEEGVIKMIHSVYNIDVEKAEDDSQALWHMLTSSGAHKTMYDGLDLSDKLIRNGFNRAVLSSFNDFRHSPNIDKVSWDMYPESSVYVVGIKK